MVEQVRPVVRPLFATPWPGTVCAFKTTVEEGGAAAMLLGPTAPRSRIVPDKSTCPETISAIAASTLLGASPQRAVVEPEQLGGSLLDGGFKALPCVRCATVSGVATEQASCKGWLIASPAAPLSDRSNTWLLLRITGLVVPVRLQRLPTVPLLEPLTRTSMA